MKNRVSVSLTAISVALLATALSSGPVNAECLVCKYNPDFGADMCQDTKNEQGWRDGYDRCGERMAGCYYPSGAVQCTHPGATADCEREGKCEVFQDWY